MGASEPDPNGEPRHDESDRRATGRVQRMRSRANEVAADAESWVEQRRRDRLHIDLLATYYERDREAFASVLGSAIALRLFLFVIPVMVMIGGATVLLFGRESVNALLQEAGAGGLAGQVASAIGASGSRGLVLFGVGLFGAAYAGRTLTAVLSACSASAWKIPARDARPTLRSAALVTGLVLGILAAVGVINRVRAEVGLGVVTLSFVASAAVFSLGWFAVSLSLPRGTRDPGAVLPGAILMGATMAVLQWAMQVWLPGRIERSSEVMGTLGVSVASLTYMFLVGRVMAATLILNPVIWDRLGSISRLVFSLPGLNVLPRRSTALRRFFDLEAGADDHPEEVAEP